ncbi:Tetratricopeptide repeat-containing protein [Pustulibacterium marinum]|uniref:Tetratricopeptide repeat-containing protein n=1 Tax=Pustulibacterium marinum TaxID=1224947 RepID=A0A1I7I7B4_9FLAO|nr:tetratricopeptide repeat protein [Pustulibacterium marinum]SFU68865.1 Tetratricopeptide repeat-containing protein [Pustulibacterium marinum]
MKQIFWVIGLVLCSYYGFSQNSQLAKQYFEDGDFDKALPLYEQLYEKQPQNTTWFNYVVECQQQMGNYEKAQELLEDKIAASRFPQPLLEVDLGQNYILQKQPEKAQTYFDKAIAYLNEKPAYAGTIGYRFRKYTLLDQAVEAYTLAMKLRPELNYNYQLAGIYGEQGNIEKMFDTFLTLSQTNDTQRTQIERAITQFISEDATDENNLLLKKLLLKRSQTNPAIIWNEMLSWLFVQQKQYNMAFIQEKAIYKRTDEISLDRLTDLALAATEDQEKSTAIDIYNFLIAHTEFAEAKLDAELAIIKLELSENSADIKSIEKKFDQLLDTYGINTHTIPLQIAYAHFIAFNKNEPNTAEKHLKKVLDLRLSPFDASLLKMELADILVFEERFNEALIYYSQIQKTMKNDVAGQNAMFKVAQTSFYKGDFDWAENQLNILKQSTSQLIANDALQLKLLITDNSQDDSLQVALKIYAKADLLAYQNKNTEAISLLDSILIHHKGESIEDEALLKQGKLYEKTGQFEKAIVNYEKMLAFFDGDILTDDALFAMASLYEHQLNDAEKAKEYYEKIIFNHQDSIYFVEARKAYRKLRGDQVDL